MKFTIFTVFFCLAIVAVLGQAVPKPAVAVAKDASAASDEDYYSSSYPAYDDESEDGVEPGSGDDEEYNSEEYVYEDEPEGEEGSADEEGAAEDEGSTEEEEGSVEEENAQEPKAAVVVA